MNFTLTATNNCSKQLAATYLKLTTLKLITRNANKIAVEVDSNIRTQIENEEIKPRQQPGRIKYGRLELPSNITSALKRVIGDYPVKQLVKDCKQLERYIVSRHPPPEQQEIRGKLQQIDAEVERHMPQAQSVDLTEEQMKHWEYKREQLKRRLTGQRVYSWKPIAYEKYEALVYAIGRGAKEYAILQRILQEIKIRDPDFKPRSYFDFGSGVGTGMWAASNLWKDSIFEYFNVDSSREMHELSELILRNGNDNQQMTLRNVFHRQFLPSIETKYDLVVTSFSLFELPSKQSRKEVILNLWRKCDGYMIIVEEGTRRGTDLVTEAREYLLRQEKVEDRGHAFAPCPHSGPCPRTANDLDRTPCNFQLLYVPLKVGDMNADHLEASYSYCVLKKGAPVDPTLHWPRLVRETLERSRHVVCNMCTKDAKLQEIIFTQSKHGRIAYRCAKTSRWGDRLPIIVGEPFETETRHAKKLKAWKDKLAQQQKIESDEEVNNSAEIETQSAKKVVEETNSNVTV